MLEVEGLHAGYGRTAVLHGMTLSVPAGSRTAVLGRNGVGKSTLLKTLIGLVPATGGRILVDGADVTGHPAHRRARSGIAYVPQGRDIFPDLSVLDNLRVADRTGRLEQVFDEFPVLREKRHAAGGSLSGGQQQILALGRALMTGPRLLLLDEPSEGIQPSIVDQIAGAVRRMNDEHGLTVLLVEQNLEFAAGVCDRALIVDKGEVVRSVRTADLLADRDMQHEYLGV
ncbi:ABC transporter ATP-binding protein [Actinoplanes sp. NPDC051851]|uniref:ABC transporter ATP-binding protein n=1 Tax=Actinoplanes sp. NPDC051851 TaxID=3154753 RepID=UPI0034493EF3